MPSIPAPPELVEMLSRDLDRSMLRDDGNVWSALQGFLHAITWTDPGVRALLALPALFVAGAVALRRRPEASIALFVLLCGAVLAARPANEFLGEKSAAREALRRRLGFSQNYFDARGVFAAALYCAPLLAVAFGMMVHALASAASLLVKVKRRELAMQARAAREGAGAPGSGAGGAAGAAGAGDDRGAGEGAGAGADPVPPAADGATSGARRRRTSEAAGAR